MVSKPPVWLRRVAPVVDAKHDGEGAGGQQLLVIVVVQAVGRCQGKSVANLFDMMVIQQIIQNCNLLVGDVLTNTLLHLLLT